MAAFNRPTEATYEIHEKVTVDTLDNEDHTFCGIMFPIKCKDLLPIDHLVIKSVAIRGQLGPLTVWVSNEDPHQRQGDRIVERQVRLNPAFWTKLYDKSHGRSQKEYKELLLDAPIKLRPGETRVIYIHSTLPGDEAIVYDNSYYGMTHKRYEDDKLAILTGRAHVSNQVFGQEPIWGWGNAWRDRREFVGRLQYGAVYKLWNPQIQPKFGDKFQGGARLLFMCQRRWESPFSMLPDECIFYILNMCRWDWFADDSDTMKQRRKKEKAVARKKREEAEAADSEETAMETAVAIAVHEQDNGTGGGCHKSQCNAIAAESSDCMNEDSDDDEYVEEEEFEDDDDDDDDEVWSDDEDQYHRSNIQAFTFRDIDSDEEEDSQVEEPSISTSRRSWIQQNFSRIHVLQALAQLEDDNVHY